jgi:tetratricopeptide (TPR) repeat protein
VFWWKRGKVEIRPLAPFLAVGVAMAIYTTGHDFVHAGHAVWFYLLKIIVPFGYTFIYPAWTDVNLLWPLSVVAAIAGLVWYAPGNRAPLAAFLIFIVTLIPVLGFPNVRDHFLYLASPVIIVLCAQFIPERAGALLVAGLGVLTFLHAGVFRDGITLYTDTIERNPDAWEAHNKLGAALLLAGKVPEAIPHLQTALQLQPQDPDIHYNLGVALASIPEYQTALRLKNDFPEAHNNLGRELAKLPGHQAEGISHIERALALNPDFADAHVNLGIALSRVPGRKGEALDQLEAGLRLDPNVPGGRHAYELLLSATPGRARESISYFETQTRQHPDSAESQNALGNALRGEPDHVPEAILHFREALRLAPNMVEARMNLANTLAQFPDRQSEAIQEYRYVLKLNPHFPEVHNNMGNALVAMNRTAEAALEFEAAIADDPTSANPHVNLGAIYFNTPGRLNEATREFETAVKLDPNLADAHTNLGLAYLQAPGQEKNAQALAEFEASLRLKPDPELKRRVEQLKLAIANQNPNFKLN